MAISSHATSLGDSIPYFSLPSVDDKTYSLESFASSKALLVAFICNHCPYVQAIEKRFLNLAHAYTPDQLQVVAICSNDWTAYPDDAPQKLLEHWRDQHFGFPYLIDESQQVAKAFDAACTPDLFLYEGQRKLFYHGRLDDNWKDESKVSRQELKEAIDLLLAGKDPPTMQHPTLGCSIKWKHTS